MLLGIFITVGHFALACVRANPAGLPAKPIRYPPVETLQSRAARVVDTRHIVPDAPGVARELAHALEDAIGRGKLLVDALLVRLPAPDLARKRPRSE